ncbi:hypothetical protein PN36_14940 [Candidatus Thiomargarita nelsonii]|uniref:Uncharacterized protein n=1 Tax=Candidatus Thiomargarita nelsonii TaxID=1003181 RepID=A0A4E0QTB9_9GAMM|nr:hypothetical protein PN36_14940 [Candidatus Thiomargarita nelsonii]
MLNLIRETPSDEIFSRQQWWSAGKYYEASVAWVKCRVGRGNPLWLPAKRSGGTPNPQFSRSWWVSLPLYPPYKNPSYARLA